jgi:hypothetical protein
MNETIAQMWDGYCRAVMPPDASTVQLWETRRAFMAGAWALLVAQQTIDESVSDDEGVAQMERWHDELRAFQRRVQEGTA